MEKYYWDQNNLRIHLASLNKMLSQNPGKAQRVLIEKDIRLIQLITDPEKTNFQKAGLIETYNSKKQEFQGLQFLEPVLSDFNDATDISTNSKYPINQSFTDDEILDITHDFYNQLPPFFGDLFMQCFEKRFDHLRFYKQSSGNQSTSGKCIPLLSMQDVYMSINRENTIIDVITAIHEYMHFISLLISPTHFLDSKKLFREVDTLFIELLAYDYLEDLLKDGNSLLAKLVDYNQKCVDAEDAATFLKLMKEEEQFPNGFVNNKQLRTSANKLGIKGKIINYLITPDTQSHIYITSYMFAIELYELYKKDPEKAMHLLRLLIESNAKSAQGYYNSFVNMGLHPTKHLEDFKKFLKDERLLRVLKK